MPEKISDGWVTEYDVQRDPQEDLENAVKAANRSGKRIILDVGGDWCIWCHKLDSVFAQNPNLNAYLKNHFILVKINYSKENKNEAFLSEFPKVTGYPHLFILNSDGMLLHSQNTAELEKGRRHDPQKVEAFLHAWSGEPL